jgi:serine protease AprX
MAKSGNQPPGRRKKKSAKEEPAASPPAAAEQPLPESDPERRPFLPETLDKTVIAIPLLEKIRAAEKRAAEDPAAMQEPIDIIIDLNLEYPGGRAAARERVPLLVEEAVRRAGKNPQEEGLDRSKSDLSPQYLFGKLSPAAIQALVKLDRQDPPWKPSKPRKGNSKPQPHAIYRIWNDFEIRALINRSVRTVKADAAHSSFAALGDGIVWAVLDSGIDGQHPHFTKYGNLVNEEALDHRDFSTLQASAASALKDPYGHGTHVAGILAGEMVASEEKPIRLMSRLRNEHGDPTHEVSTLKSGAITGIAPKCKLVSLKVLDDNGRGKVSNLIAAIAHVQEVNGHGRRIRIHGINMSVGYDFEPEWFACGQSPLCVEVDRLVRSGVVVVVAAGNTGYGWNKSQARGVVAAGMDLTINDPGNADLAITVGSTHRDMPHIYGVSYFSSKGPTGDGRLKPDLVAPGEKILSCAAGRMYRDTTSGNATEVECDYREDSGTSMAAPHVAGVIAAFLSVRREFVGRPEVVKEIFLSTATDLKRDRYFQGHGLVDLMRAIQSV